MLFCSNEYVLQIQLRYLIWKLFQIFTFCSKTETSQMLRQNLFQFQTRTSDTRICWWNCRHLTKTNETGKPNQYSETSVPQVKQLKVWIYIWTLEHFRQQHFSVLSVFVFSLFPWCKLIFSNCQVVKHLEDYIKNINIKYFKMGCKDYTSSTFWLDINARICW